MDPELTQLLAALRSKGVNIPDRVSSLPELTIAIESGPQLGGASDDLGAVLDDIDGEQIPGRPPMVLSDGRGDSRKPRGVLGRQEQLARENSAGYRGPVSRRVI